MLKFVFLLVLAAFATAIPTPAFPNFGARVDPNTDWRIVGGSDAPEGAYPFIVSFRSLAGTHFCGGSIITREWILTAAHCIVSRTTENTVILAGTNTLDTGGVTGDLNRIVIHSSYNPETIENDISLVGLSTALVLSGNPQLIGLNTLNTEAVPAIVIGWGRLFTDGPTSNNLQHLNTNTITHAQCQAIWGNTVSILQICAFTQSGEGSCHGDSGGPLIQSSNRALVGIVSFTANTGCGSGFPDVYVRVSAYIDWIMDVIFA